MSAPRRFREDDCRNEIDRILALVERRNNLNLADDDVLRDAIYSVFDRYFAYARQVGSRVRIPLAESTPEEKECEK